MSNSIIDAQIELEEQVILEIQRCKNFKYWYETYYFPTFFNLDTDFGRYDIRKFSDIRFLERLEKDANIIWRNNY